MMTPEQVDRVQAIVDEELSAETHFVRTAELQSAPELQYLARYYNWDDGFALPSVIADHPQCDLAVALTLFYQVEGLVWLAGDAGSGPHNAEWIRYCELLSSRIASGRYRAGQASFKCDIGRASLYRYRKQGVPEIFLADVVGVEAEARP